MDERANLLMRELHEGGADLGALTAAFSAIDRGRRPREAFDTYVTAAHARRDDDLLTDLKKGTTHGI